MLKKNQELILHVDGMSAEGTGIGHHDGQAVFVSGTAIGDEIRCHIIKAKKNYAVGKLQEILQASPDRIPADCAVAGRCGGCCFRHVSYEAELQYKQQRVEDAFRRIGHIDCAVSPILGSAEQTRYRNKAQYPVGNQDGLQVGFYTFHSHRIVPCTDCLLQPALFANLIQVITDWVQTYSISIYQEASHTGLLRHLYFREGHFSKELMVCLVVTDFAVPHLDELLQALQQFPTLKTVVLNRNAENTNVILGKDNKVLLGNGYIQDQLLGKRFRISPLSFYQVNSAQCEVLYSKAAEYAQLTKEDTLLDLYCGTGTIGLTMADRVNRIYGVELIPEAVEDAKRNAADNGITNAVFFCGDAAKAALRLKQDKVHADVILVDPPRKGLSRDLIPILAGFAPKRIVYVSCDPATLARDCALLQEEGYIARAITPVDMFPRTAHVETVVLLSKEKLQSPC